MKELWILIVVNLSYSGEFYSNYVFSIDEHEKDCRNTITKIHSDTVREGKFETKFLENEILEIKYTDAKQYYSCVSQKQIIR